MSISEAFRTWLLQPVTDALTKLNMEALKMSTTQAQFDQFLATLGTTLTSEDATIQTTLTAISTAVTALQAAATAGGVDLTQEATAVQSMISDIQNQTTSLATAAASISSALPTPPASPSVAK
jgi:hypothetical protein